MNRSLESRRRAEKGGAVCGIDEAGRGPIAGPVVAAAVILPPKLTLTGLADSKKLAPQRRQALAEALRHEAAIAVGMADESEIEALNILHATMLAMRRATESLIQSLIESQSESPGESRAKSSGAVAPKPVWALIDGNRVPENLPCPGEALVRGDDREACIAAASIIAKTHRDKIMCELSVQYPGYGFERHAGYPTAAHVAALKSLGPSPVHRRSFRPVRDMFT